MIAAVGTYQTIVIVRTVPSENINEEKFKAISIGKEFVS